MPARVGCRRLVMVGCVAVCGRGVGDLSKVTRLIESGIVLLQRCLQELDIALAHLLIEDNIIKRKNRLLLVRCDSSSHLRPPHRLEMRLNLRGHGMQGAIMLCGGSSLVVSYG